MEKYNNYLVLNKKKLIISIISFIIVLTLFIWSIGAINAPEITQGGIEVSKNILYGILTPSIDKIFSLSKDSVIYLLFETIMIAFLGTLIGAFIAMFFSFVGSNNLTPKPIHFTIRIILTIIRTIPALVYGIIVIKVTGPGAFAGVITFSIVSIGMMAKLYIEDIEESSTGLLEVSEVAGLNWIKKIRLVIFPQVLNSIVSTYIYRFEINLREASILGLIGAGGLGTPLMLAMGEQRWHDVGAYLLGLIILVLIVEFISTKVRAKLTRG